jgi:hypothetical protein
VRTVPLCPPILWVLTRAVHSSQHLISTDSVVVVSSNRLTARHYEEYYAQIIMHCGIGLGGPD